MRAISYFLILVIFCFMAVQSCSKDSKNPTGTGETEQTDARKDLTDAYGVPDYIEKSDVEDYEYLVYVYARKDLNRVYYLKENSDGDYYIYAVYYADEMGYDLYIPPTITHTSISTAPAGETLSVFANVTDDNSLSTVALYYFHKTAADTVHTEMHAESTGSSTYKATIPASFMTAGEIEYYFVATDDEAYYSRLPKKGNYTITVLSSSKL